MVARNSKPRPSSYAVTKFSVKHLEILQHTLAEFAEIMRPSFTEAGKEIAVTRFSKKAVILHGSPGEKYQSPAELRGWLEKKIEKIIDFRGRVEQLDTDLISGKDLNNLRETRAFIVRFKSMANRIYDGGNNFAFHEREITKLLWNDIDVESGKGGILDVLQNVLQNEQSKSSKDLEPLEKTMSFGKTLKAVLIQRHKESGPHTTTIPERDFLSQATPPRATREPSTTAAVKLSRPTNQLLF